MMEKKILKFMQKPVTFQNQKFSPNKYKSHVGIGFSGQLIPTRTPRSTEREEEEPTSPKVSCMGRIKHRNRERNNKKLVEDRKEKVSYSRGVFGKPEEKRTGVPPLHPKVPERTFQVPDLSHMRRYASGRETLAGFNWKTHIAPVDAKDQNIYFRNGDSEEENDVMIPFSAPLTIGGLGAQSVVDLKPKKEINLWKRRTMAQPRPLQVDLFN